jgi:hypothetical protein
MHAKAAKHRGFFVIITQAADWRALRTHLDTSPSLRDPVLETWQIWTRHTARKRRHWKCRVLSLRRQFPKENLNSRQQHSLKAGFQRGARSLERTCHDVVIVIPDHIFSDSLSNFVVSGLCLPQDAN